MINSLQSLRGIFAIFIFLHHIMLNGENLFRAGGPCGVCFFFILSGFVMCAGWEKKIDTGAESKTRLFLRRIIRVYPLHFLCLGIVIFLSIGSFSSTYFLKLIPNILLLQSWIPIKSIYFSGNALSWCLSDLMFFYVAFPFIVKFIESYKKSSLGIFIAIIICYLTIVSFIPQKHLHALVYINPVFRLIDFLIGIFLWQIWISVRNNEHLQLIISTFSPVSVNFIEIFSITVLAVFILLFSFTPKVYWYDAYWWIPSSILILTFTIFNKSGGGVDILLNKKLLVEFGNVSFSFYMIHIIGLNLLGNLYSSLFGECDILLTILPSFIVIAVVSYFIYRYYETPVSRFFINLLKKKSSEKSLSV